MTVEPTPIRKEASGLIRLALPLALGHLGTHAMGLVDIAVVGRFSESALAATGLGNSIYFGLTVLGMGVMFALDPLISQAVGARRDRDADQLFWQGMWLALFLTVPVCILVYGTASALALSPIDPSVVEQAQQYVHARLLSTLPLLAFVGARSYLQSYNITRPFVIAVLFANLLNVPLNVVLVFGDAGLAKLGLPPLGMQSLGAAGAGWATVVAALVQMTIMLTAALSHRPSLQDTSRALNRLLLHRALRVGVPIALTIFAEVAVFAFTGVLAGWLGATPLAAHNVALVLAGTTFQVALAVGSAASIRVGQAIGAQDLGRVRRAGFIALALGTAWMSLGAAVFIVFARRLVSFMTDEPEVISAAVPLMYAAAAFQLVDGAQAVMNGALRGAADTRFTFIASIISHYLVGLPIALIAAFVFDWKAQGLWWGLCAGLAVVAFTLTARFSRLCARPLHAVQ